MTRILVLDDDEAVRQTLAQVLTEHGYHVDTAADGAEGSRALSTETYDVLFLDMLLDGGRTGLEVLRDLAMVERKRPPPTIILTGFQRELVMGLLDLEPEIAHLMFPHGHPPLILYKPVRTAELINAVVEALKSAES